MNQVKLTLLFDGACPFCRREVNFLHARDVCQSICFVDIDSPNYQAQDYLGITYREAMGRIHAINSSGQIIKDVSVFREAYRLVGLGWIYVPTTWPLLGPSVEKFYQIWTRWRLILTMRDSLEQLCDNKESCFKE